RSQQARPNSRESSTSRAWTKTASCFSITMTNPQKSHAFGNRRAHCGLEVSTEVDFETELMHDSGFGKHCQASTAAVRTVRDLDMIRFVSSHHLVASYTLQNGVHDRPLWGG